MKKATIIFLITIAVAAALMASACSKPRLAAPTWVTIDDELNLTWEEVDSARSYLVEIKSVADKIVVEKKTKTASYSLESLEEGDYELRIRAVADERKNSNSAWSSVTEMHKDKENGCIYKLINNSTEYKLVKYGTSSGVVVIDDVFRNKPVTMIDAGAFRGSSKVEEVYINGDSVTDIGEYAFYNCQNLRKVVISDSVKSIGVRAFQACRKLAEVNIPSGVRSISEYAFNYCTSLTSITIPEGVVNIEKSAFAGCYSLKEVTLPDSLVVLGEAAFSSCFNENNEGGNLGLEKVVLGKNLTVIGVGAFESNRALKTVVFPEQSSLKTISSSAFYSCDSLAEISLPAGLQTISSLSFANCASLGSVIIPSTVVSVGYQAFFYTGFHKAAKQANEPYIYADNWLIDVSDDVFSLTDITSNTSSSAVSVFLRSDIVGIADRVFLRSDSSTQKPSAIEKVYLPNSVKYIGYAAFANNKKMTRFYAAPTTSKLVSIGASAFENCQSLQRLTLPNGLKTIGNYAFMSCLLLDNNEANPLIPASVTSVGSYAFKGTALWDTPDESGVIYAGSWAVGFNDKKLAQTITIKEGTSGISDYAFYQAGVRTVNAAAVSYVGDGAFYECENLQNIVFNANIDEIGDFAFYKCTNLLSIRFPSMLTRIGRSTFYKCSSLYEINLKNTKVEQIDVYAFYNCTSLKNIQLREGLKSIGDFAFYGNTSLEAVNIPSTVETIGIRSFSKATALSSLTFDKNKNGESSLKSISDYAFNGVAKLESLEIPSSVKTIGSKAFYGCESIKSLVLNEGIETIGDYAFFKLNSISKLVLPSSLQSVGKFAFSYFYIDPNAGKTPSDSSSSSGSSSSSTEGSSQDSSVSSADDSSGSTVKPVVHTSSVTSVILKKSISVLGAHAFYGYGKATFYTDAEKLPGKWDKFWNSSFRPVVWGCEFSEDGSYVVSFTKTETSVSNPTALNGISAPTRNGYTFLGWSSAYGSLTAEYTAQSVTDAPNGTKLYAVWQAN